MSRQYFKIAPKGNNRDMVLIVHGAEPGAKVKLWSSKAASMDSQLFYEEARTCTIRNKINDYCLDVNRSKCKHDNRYCQWNEINDILLNISLSIEIEQVGMKSVKF